MKEKNAVRGARGRITDDMRQPCEIYLRVMGYYAPISAMNHGKKSEAYSRQYFDEGKTLASLDAALSNNSFCARY